MRRVSPFSHRHAVRLSRVIASLMGIADAATDAPSAPSPAAAARRNAVIRLVGTLCADLGVGVLVASAVSWVIQAASLGLFLAFLLWLLGALVALALSQYVVHPLATVVLSDRKLDLVLSVVDASLTGMRRWGKASFASPAPTA